MKPIGDWTLKEVKNECRKHADCSFCDFHDFCLYLHVYTPKQWKVEDKRKLTINEISLLKITGARYATRDIGETSKVYLWEEKPILDDGEIWSGMFEPFSYVNSNLLHSIQPGDCICVEDYR